MLNAIRILFYIVNREKWLTLVAFCLLAMDAGCNYALYQWGYSNGQQSAQRDR